MVDHRQAILSFIKLQGPSLPAAIAKHMKMELLFASAHLAEMTESGKLKSSALKIGGSPLYYIPGQEHLLENFSSNLGEKDKRAFAVLKEEKLLKEDELDPLTRVAIKNLKDFAIPVVVSHDNIQEQFWKWHSISNDEVQSILKSEFSTGVPKEETKESQHTQETTIVLKKEEPQNATKEQKKDAKQEVQKPLASQAEEKPAQKKEKKEKIKNADDFLEQITVFFAQKNIIIKEQTVLKKNIEIDFIVHIPSALGNLEYYCKAKNKKKLGDADISSAFVQAQIRKLPVILLSSGEPSKKALEVLSPLKGIVLCRLD